MNRRLAALFAVALAPLVVVLFVQAQPTPPAPGLLQPPTPAAQPVAAAAESLDGTWELVSVIDEGKVIPLEIIKQTMIKDARVVIKGPIAAITRPDGKLQTMAFVTNPKANPKTLDLAGAIRVGGKGIYMRDGNTLMICTRGSDSEARPAMMASLPGSDTFLMTFQRVEAPIPAQLPPVPPSAAPASADATTRMLIGTWGHQTDDEIVKAVFNADGTFSISTSYKKGFKKVFDQNDRTSGKWDLKDGTVTLTVNASTQKEKRGQVYSYRITSITDAEVLYIDNVTGARRIEWKLR